MLVRKHTHRLCDLFFFFKDPAPTEIYPLPHHAALPLSGEGPPQPGPADPVARLLDQRVAPAAARAGPGAHALAVHQVLEALDRKSTRLNSSHANISYAVFCLKKKKN